MLRQYVASSQPHKPKIDFLVPKQPVSYYRTYFLRKKRNHEILERIQDLFRTRWIGLGGSRLPVWRSNFDRAASNELRELKPSAWRGESAFGVRPVCLPYCRGYG